MDNYETFVWRPLFDPDLSVEHRVLGVQFGDGYEQMAGDGINTRKETWSLTFVGKKSVIDDIRAFIDRHKGYIPFKWKTTDGREALFRASTTYRVTRQSTAINTIAVTFTECFV